MDEPDRWTLAVHDGLADDGVVNLVLELDPQRRRVLLFPMAPGQGSAEVGQLAVYRVFYERAPTALAAAFLAGPEAAALLAQVHAGCAIHRTWSGDRMGQWTPEGWAAAVAVADGVNAALDEAAAQSAGTKLV